MERSGNRDCVAHLSGLEAETIRAELARRACGDIPPRFCTVVDVAIDGDIADVWLLTNEPPHCERYQVRFRREGDGWTEVLMAGGFQTGTPDHVHQRAQALEHPA